VESKLLDSKNKKIFLKGFLYKRTYTPISANTRGHLAGYREDGGRGGTE